MNNIFDNSVVVKIYKTIARWYSGSVLYKIILFIQHCFSESYINKSLQKYAIKRPKALYNSALYKIFRKIEYALSVVSKKLKLKEHSETSMLYRIYTSVKNTKHGGSWFLVAFAIGFFAASTIIKGFVLNNLIIAVGILVLAGMLSFVTAENYKGSFVSKIIKVIIE